MRARARTVRSTDGVPDYPYGDADFVLDVPGPGGSTWQSLARGHSLEVDYLNGEIVLLGRQLGIATPVNAALQRVANAAARAGARPGSMTLAELEAALRS